MPSPRRFIALKTDITAYGLEPNVIEEVIDFLKEQPEFAKVAKQVHTSAQSSKDRFEIQMSVALPRTYFFYYKAYRIKAVPFNGELQIEIRKRKSV